MTWSAIRCGEVVTFIGQTTAGYEIECVVVSDRSSLARPGPPGRLGDVKLRQPARPPDR